MKQPSTKTYITDPVEVDIIRSDTDLILKDLTEEQKEYVMGFYNPTKEDLLDERLKGEDWALNKATVNMLKRMR